jgi:hypothetical protein
LPHGALKFVRAKHSLLEHVEDRNSPFIGEQFDDAAGLQRLGSQS